MNNEINIMLFPPAGGDNLCYYEMKNYFKEPATVCMLESNGLKNGIFQYDFQKLIDEYVAQILKRFPKKKYHLCGWSFGGLSALEVSRSLGKYGYEIFSVHLIDTYSPIRLKQADEMKELAIVKIIMNDLGGLFGIKPTITDEDFFNIHRDKRLELVLDFFKDRCYHPERFFNRRKEEFRANLWSMYNFVPEQYPDTIFFYQAADQVKGNSCTTREGWERWLNSEDIRTSNIAGNHYTVLQSPQVTVLCDKIHDNIVTTTALKNAI